MTDNYPIMSKWRLDCMTNGLYRLTFVGHHETVASWWHYPSKADIDHALENVAELDTPMIV